MQGELNTWKRRFLQANVRKHSHSVVVFRLCSVLFTYVASEIKYMFCWIHPVNKRRSFFFSFFYPFITSQSLPFNLWEWESQCFGNNECRYLSGYVPSCLFSILAVNECLLCFKQQFLRAILWKILSHMQEEHLKMIQVCAVLFTRFCIRKSYPNMYQFVWDILVGILQSYIFPLLTNTCIPFNTR